MLVIMKVLAYLLVSAAASADASIEKPNKPDGKKKRTNAHSTLLQKAFDRRSSEHSPPHMEAIHDRVQKKYSQHINGTEEKPDPRAEKRKQRNQRRSAHSAEENGRVLKKSKKSRKSRYSSDSSSSSDDDDYKCEVTVTNLSAFQWFEDFFVMIHSDKLDYPIFGYGEPAVFFKDSSTSASGDDMKESIDNGLSELALEGYVDLMEDFYEDQDHVYDADDLAGPLKGGQSVTFQIEYTDTYDKISVATSLLFTNDGFIGINGVALVDGLVAFIDAMDAGVEANVATCWSVKGKENDFPVGSECADDRKTGSNENENRGLPGEGFVHVHRGVIGIENDDIFKDFFEFYECDENGANTFADYFFNIGSDQDFLLTINDDKAFIEAADINDYDDDLLEVAADSNNFGDFCDQVKDILNDIFDDYDDEFTTLEPEIFDWRNPIMSVSLQCEDD